MNCLIFCRRGMKNQRGGKKLLKKPKENLENKAEKLKKEELTKQKRNQARNQDKKVDNLRTLKMIKNNNPKKRV